jgi:hypothetical protein
MSTTPGRWRAFLRGAASLLDFQGALVPRHPVQTDREAIAQVWREVGGDLAEALSQYPKQHDPQGER